MIKKTFQIRCIIFLIFSGFLVSGCGGGGAKDVRNFSKKYKQVAKSRELISINKIESFDIFFDGDENSASISLIDLPDTIRCKFMLKNTTNVLYVKLIGPNHLNLNRFLLNPSEYEFDRDNKYNLSLLIDLPIVYIANGNTQFNFEILTENLKSRRVKKQAKTLFLTWKPYLSLPPETPGYKFVDLFSPEQYEDKAMIKQKFLYQKDKTNMGRLSDDYRRFINRIFN